MIVVAGTADRRHRTSPGGSVATANKSERMFRQNPISMNVPFLEKAEVFAGLGILTAIVALAFIVVWICFPFIVSGKLNRVIELAEYQAKLLETIAKNTAGTEGEQTEASPAVRKPDEGWKER